jgi:hypothetical protein
MASRVLATQKPSPPLHQQPTIKPAIHPSSAPFPPTIPSSPRCDAILQLEARLLPELAFQHLLTKHHSHRPPHHTSNSEYYTLFERTHERRLPDNPPADHPCTHNLMRIPSMQSNCKQRLSLSTTTATSDERIKPLLHVAAYVATWAFLLARDAQPSRQKRIPRYLRSRHVTSHR